MYSTSSRAGTIGPANPMREFGARAWTFLTLTSDGLTVVPIHCDTWVSPNMAPLLQAVIAITQVKVATERNGATLMHR
jgi:hypothetical protein